MLALGAGQFYRNYCDGFASRFRASVADAYGDHVSGKEVEAQADAFCGM